MESETSFPAENFLDLERTEHSALFASDQPVWSALSQIAPYLEKQLNLVEGEKILGEVDERAIVGPNVYIAKGAIVEPNAVIKGPAWIGEGTTVRSGAYIRENVIAGKNCTLGNSSEFKNCVLFDSCEVPHFNYVGDSILGYKAHLGAGVICSNVRLDRKNVTIWTDSSERIDTGLRKFGAIVGDLTEVGCNSVINPGSILGKNCIIYPCTHWNGILSDQSIVKNRQKLQVIPKRDLG